MTITLTIPDTALAAEQSHVDKFNASSGLPSHTIESFAQLERDEVTVARLRDKADADRAAMAANDELIQVGLEIASAPPEKQAAAIAAGRAALAD